MLYPDFDDDDELDYDEADSYLDEDDEVSVTNSMDDYTSFMIWGTDYEDKNNY